MLNSGWNLVKTHHMKVNSQYYKECLKEHLSFRVEKNARYSLRAYAKSLNIDVSDLSKVFSDKKALSIPSAEKVTAHLGLDPDERDLFMLSVFSDHQERGRKHKYPDLIVREINRSEKNMDLETFRTVSDWYHYAILEMTYTEELSNDMVVTCRRISQRLGVGQTEARLAIERLLKLELLKEEDGVFKKSNQQLNISSQSSKSIAATKKFLKQSIVKSEEALDNCPANFRENRVVTLAIDPDKLDEVKTLVDDFHSKLMKFLESGKREKIYHLSMNLYPVEQMRPLQGD